MTYQVQVAIPYFNNLPRDCSTNVFHFDWVGAGGPDDAELGVLFSALEIFYESAYADTGMAASYADNGATRFKAYNLADTPPRVPMFSDVRVVSLNKESTTIIPPEVAVVASYHGAHITGQNLASERGRIYLGVLGSGVVQDGTLTAFPTVSEGFRTNVNGAANTLVADAITAGFNWVVYSPTLQESFVVVGGHCDDAFDSQRRRGQDPTIRNTWGS